MAEHGAGKSNPATGAFDDFRTVSLRGVPPAHENPELTV